MHNPETVMENETHKLLWDFEIRTDRQILARSDFISKKERTCRIVECTVPADYRVKLKECKKRIEKIWNMKVTIIPFVIGALCTVYKGLVLRLEDL